MKKRVLFTEDFDADIIKEYKDKGFKVYIKSKRKIKRRDHKTYNKLKNIGLSEDCLVFGDFETLDKRYNFDEIRDHEYDNTTLSKLLSIGKEYKDVKVIKSSPVCSMEEAQLAQTESIKDVDLKFVSVKVVYSYQVRPNVPDAESGSRNFCERLMSANKKYTLDEISSISTSHLTDMGLPPDVFAYRGGFYHNPITGETTPYCRHQWVSEVIIEY